MKNITIAFKVSAKQAETIKNAYVFWLSQETDVVTFSEFLRQMLLIDSAYILQEKADLEEKKTKK